MLNFFCSCNFVFQVQGLPLHGISSRNYDLYVGGAAINYFHCISVYNFSEGVGLMETLVNDF